MSIFSKTVESQYYPSPLQFHDLICHNPFRQDAEPLYVSPREARLGDETLRTMVSLNRQRRVAQEQRLFFVETTPGQPGLGFANDQAITGTLESAAEAQLLLAGFKLVNALGGGRSRGLGWIQSPEAEATFGGEPVTLGNWEALREQWLS